MKNYNTRVLRYFLEFFFLILISLSFLVVLAIQLYNIQFPSIFLASLVIFLSGLISLIFARSQSIYQLSMIEINKQIKINYYVRENEFSVVINNREDLNVELIRGWGATARVRSIKILNNREVLLVQHTNNNWNPKSLENLNRALIDWKNGIKVNSVFAIES